MAIQLQLRRGTTQENVTFIGAVGEITVDTTIFTLRVHDGITYGGHELALANLSNVTISKSLVPNSFGIYNLGHQAATWKDLYLSGSVKFSNGSISTIPQGFLLKYGTKEFKIDQDISTTSSPTFESINLKQARTIFITGDINYTSTPFDGTTDMTGVATLSTVNSTPGKYGSSRKIPILTVNEKGLVIEISEEDNESLLPDILEEGTFGEETKIPIITVNKKGLITNISQKQITLPIIGDSGTFGSTTKIPVLTIDDHGLVVNVSEVENSALLPDIIEPGTFGSITKNPVITVNEKGIITNISDVESPDIIEPGTIGSSTSIPIITYDSKGIITSVDSHDIKVDFVVVNDVEQRNAIEEKNIGMLVLTRDTNKLWQYRSDYSWVEYITRPYKQNITKNINNVMPFDYVDFSLPIGDSVIAYSVTVSHACIFEVFEGPDRLDTNPYKFISTEDHLHDDGSSLLSDGTILRGRRYYIWSSFDGLNNIYCRVTNSSDTQINQFSVSIVYSSVESSLLI